jgi:hypothetical protein
MRLLGAGAKALDRRSSVSAYDAAGNIKDIASLVDELKAKAGRAVPG